MHNCLNYINPKKHLPTKNRMKEIDEEVNEKNILEKWLNTTAYTSEVTFGPSSLENRFIISRKWTKFQNLLHLY